MYINICSTLFIDNEIQVGPNAVSSFLHHLAKITYLLCYLFCIAQVNFLPFPILDCSYCNSLKFYKDVSQST